MNDKLLRKSNIHQTNLEILRIKQLVGDEIAAMRSENDVEECVLERESYCGSDYNSHYDSYQRGAQFLKMIPESQSNLQIYEFTIY